MLDLTRYSVERNPGPVETIADMPSAGTKGRDWRPCLLGDWFEEQVELRLQAHAAVQDAKRVGDAHRAVCRTWLARMSLRHSRCWQHQL